MAIANSVALGKVRGAVGNVIFQYYKGNSVVRQRNLNISTAPTVAQINQRNQMTNTGTLYRSMSGWLSVLDRYTKKYGSVYNWFVKSTNGWLPTAITDNVSILQNGLYKRQIKMSNWIIIMEINPIESGTLAGGTEILINMNGINLDENIYINLFAIDSESGQPVNIRREITLAEIAAQTINVLPIDSGNDTPSAFIDGDVRVNISNIGWWKFDV